MEVRVIAGMRCVRRERVGRAWAVRRAWVMWRARWSAERPPPATCSELTCPSTPTSLEPPVRAEPLDDDSRDDGRHGAEKLVDHHQDDDLDGDQTQHRSDRGPLTEARPGEQRGNLGPTVPGRASRLGPARARLDPRGRPGAARLGVMDPKRFPARRIAWGCVALFVVLEAVVKTIVDFFVTPAVSDITRSLASRSRSGSRSSAQRSARRSSDGSSRVASPNGAGTTNAPSCGRRCCSALSAGSSSTTSGPSRLRRHRHAGLGPRPLDGLAHRHRGCDLRSLRPHPDRPHACPGSGRKARDTARARLARPRLSRPTPSSPTRRSP